MDFGLAKERRAGAELQKLTATGIILGTPEFMSPEQLRGKVLDPRTDIYSLALMTCEMLTGRLPFQGRTQQELMIARLRSDPTPLRKVRGDLQFPEAVEDVLLKGLQRNPDDRYQTALEFADALTRAAASGFRKPESEPPVDARRGSEMTLIPRALALGRHWSSVIERGGARPTDTPVSARRSTSRITRSPSKYPTPERQFALRRRSLYRAPYRATRSSSICSTSPSAVSRSMAARCDLPKRVGRSRSRCQSGRVRASSTKSASTTAAR
jgi:serine/threonine protein kinase